MINTTSVSALQIKQKEISEYICMAVFSDDISCSGFLPSQLGLLNTPTAPLQRKKHSHNECASYDTKPSDGETQLLKL